jgi:hypothetical protein
MHARTRVAASRTDGLADGGQQHVHARGDALLRQHERKHAARNVQNAARLVLLVVVRAAPPTAHVRRVMHGRVLQHGRACHV